VELAYTLPQDFMLFVMLQLQDIGILKRCDPTCNRR
jgi:hypothetical protein